MTPSQADITAATPRCKQRRLRNWNWTDCDQPLRWRHELERWDCPQHGPALSAQHAADRVTIAARTITSGP